MTVRRLWVLVSKLPADSRSQQALYGEEIAVWTPQGQQRGALIHHTEVANWQRSNGKRADRPKPPKPPSGRVRLRLPDDL
jgi:hypothetical protein